MKYFIFYIFISETDFFNNHSRLLDFDSIVRIP